MEFHQLKRPLLTLALTGLTLSLAACGGEQDTEAPQPSAGPAPAVDGFIPNKQAEDPGAQPKKDKPQVPLVQVEDCFKFKVPEGLKKTDRKDSLIAFKDSIRYGDAVRHRALGLLTWNREVSITGQGALDLQVMAIEELGLKPENVSTRQKTYGREKALVIDYKAEPFGATPSLGRWIIIPHLKQTHVIKLGALTKGQLDGLEKEFVEYLEWLS